MTHYAVTHSVPVILMCLLSAIFAKGANTIHVPADQPTIQAAINAASNGDTVIVAPGTYVENINFMGKAITVKSSNGPRVTIIDGNAAAPVAVFTQGEGPKSVLSGFTLQNGVSTIQYLLDGGGIFISFSSPMIRGNIIRNNSANGFGGGIAVYFGSPLITGNSITSNSAQFGGGVAFVDASNGGQMLHNTITKNSAGVGGGVELFSAANVLIEDNKIMNNSGLEQGGGIHIVNEADEAIVQNLIAKNTSFSGSQIYSHIPMSTKGFALINNTIVSAAKSGADAAVIADGINENVLIENNIVSAPGDKAAILCNDPPIVEFNDAFNPTLAYGDSCSGFDGENGNISANPLFVSTSNYQLTVPSPAINAGSNSAPDLPTKDLAGHPRIVGGTIDMGAYEFRFWSSEECCEPESGRLIETRAE